MKKIYLLSGIFAIMASSVFAQTAPSHDKYVDYASKTEWSTAYQGLSESEIGQKALYQGYDATAAENEEFFISRVKPRKRFVFNKTQVKESMTPDRKFLWWCPIGSEGWNALPTYWFGGEVWTMWSYTDIFGNWTAPMVRMPAAMLDVCHKNGVLTSTLASVPWAAYISPDQIPHGANFKAMIDGGATKFLKYLRYYGIDGIGFNSEFTFSGTVSGKSFAVAMKEFLSNCFKNKSSYDMDCFHNCWYSLMTSDGSCGGSLALSSGNQDWFHYNGAPTSNAYFMNYGFNTSYLNTSKNTAESFGRSSYDVYAGIDYQGSSSAYWPDLVNAPISLGIWGAHNMNMIYESRGELGANPAQMQKTYQLISENVFSGANYNPVNRPELNYKHSHSSTASEFWGFSTFITARSTLTPQDGGSLATDPFVTYFNLGNGAFFNFEGKRTFNQEWYNIGIQDYMPTWRWWWTKSFMGKNASDASTDLTAEFTWDDAWFGGSCLQISGATDKAYLQLFKTKYPVINNDKITIRYKVVSGSGSIALTTSTENQPTTEISATIIANAAAEDEWVEKTIKVAARSGIKVGGETLAMFGLKFTNTSSDFKVLIGEFSLTRGTSTTPGAPTVTMSKTLARNYKGVDMKIVYDMSAYDKNSTGRKQYESMYNVDVDAWYYKIYTQQEGCDPVLCTATTSWAAYVVGAPYDIEKGGKIRIGVSAVSLDGESESTQVWGAWQSVPANQTIEGFSIDKPIIKANEEFTVAFDDPTHAAATWVIKASENDAVMGTFNANSFTTSLASEGIYDLYLTMNGQTEVYRGKIQISPASVGALPEIKTLTMVGDKGYDYVEVGETATFSYTGRSDADGYVSRGFAFGEKAFGIPADQLNFNGNSEFSITFWVYFNAINHQEDGTQLLNVRSSADSYPAGDWGYIWSQLVPEGKKDDDGNSYHENNLMFHYRLSNNAGVPVQVSNDFVFKPQTWYHVAMIVGNSGANKTLTLYINGKLVGSGVSSGSLYSWKSSNSIMIGGRASKRSGIDGALDEVRLYKKTLTAAEVKASMQHANSVTDANFIGYWDFETDAASDNSMASTGYDKNLKAYKLDPQNIQNAEYTKENVSYAAGAPFISGTNYKIETLPTWSLKKASIISSNGNKDAGTAKAVYSAEGNFAATLTLANGWGSDTKSIEGVTVYPTGIEDVTLEEMQAFPNPFENEVYVNFAEDGIYTVELYDNAGRMLSQASIAATAGEIVNIPVEGEAGIYFIKVKGEAGLLKVMKVAKK